MSALTKKAGISVIMKKKTIKLKIKTPEDYEMYFVFRAIDLEKRLSHDRTHLRALGIND